jgi:hypothetical protein
MQVAIKARKSHTCHNRKRFLRLAERHRAQIDLVQAGPLRSPTSYEVSYEGHRVTDFSGYGGPWAGQDLLEFLKELVEDRHPEGQVAFQYPEKGERHEVVFRGWTPMLHS